MNCENCGKKITRAYEWQGKTLGSSCFRKVNPWDKDPARTLFLVAEKFLDGDKSALSLIPATWRRFLTNSYRVKNSAEAAAIFGGSHAYRLAIETRNDIARTGQKVFPLQDLLDLR